MNAAGGQIRCALSSSLSMRTHLGIFIESFEQVAALVTWFGHGPETLGSSGFNFVRAPVVRHLRSDDMSTVRQAIVAIMTK